MMEFDKAMVTITSRIAAEIETEAECLVGKTSLILLRYFESCIDEQLDENTSSDAQVALTAIKKNIQFLKISFEDIEKEGLLDKAWHQTTVTNFKGAEA